MGESEEKRKGFPFTEPHFISNSKQNPCQLYKYVQRNVLRISKLKDNANCRWTEAPNDQRRGGEMEKVYISQMGKKFMEEFPKKRKSKSA